MAGRDGGAEKAERSRLRNLPALPAPPALPACKPLLPYRSGVQFCSSVMGAAASSSAVLIRNRPSRVTSTAALGYCPNRRQRSALSATGGPASTWCPWQIGAAIISPLANSITLPSDRQREIPPAADTATAHRRRQPLHLAQPRKRPDVDLRQPGFVRTVATRLFRDLI